jgi:hypothetical protein
LSEYRKEGHPADTQLQESAYFVAKIRYIKPRLTGEAGNRFGSPLPCHDKEGLHQLGRV